MRGTMIVVLVLGGLFVWWMLKPSAPVEAKSIVPTEAPESLGRPMPRPTKNGAETAAAPASAEKPSAPAIEAPEVPESADPASDDRPSGAELAAGGRIALADCFLHRPGELTRYLDELGSSIGEGEKRFVLACSHAVDGVSDSERRELEALKSGSSCSEAERGLIGRILSNDIGRASETQSGIATTDPVLLAVEMACASALPDLQRASSQPAAAAEVYSTLIQRELSAPWPADRALLKAWSEALASIQPKHRWSRLGDWRGLEVDVKSGDSLVSIRKRIIEDHPDLLICTGLIDRANGLGGRVIRPGDKLRVPTDPANVVVDLDARWALYRLGDEVVAAWEVGVGRSGKETRPGTYTVGDKQAEPMWFPTGGEPVPFGDPSNPLGTRWVAWKEPSGKNSGLGFHGTNDPAGIGSAVSEGCVRMRNQDVEQLFEVLPIGATVVVQP